jgi:hypothetical protein
MRFGLSVRVGIFCVLSCVYAGSIFIVKVMRLGFVGEVQKASNLGRRMSKVVAGLEWKDAAQKNLDSNLDSDWWTWTSLSVTNFFVDWNLFWDVIKLKKLGIIGFMKIIIKKKIKI